MQTSTARCWPPPRALARPPLLQIACLPSHHPDRLSAYTCTYIQRETELLNILCTKCQCAHRQQQFQPQTIPPERPRLPHQQLQCSVREQPPLAPPALKMRRELQASVQAHLVSSCTFCFPFPKCVFVKLTGSVQQVDRTVEDIEHGHIPTCSASSEALRGTLSLTLFTGLLAEADCTDGMPKETPEKGFALAATDGTTDAGRRVLTIRRALSTASLARVNAPGSTCRCTNRAQHVRQKVMRNDVNSFALADLVLFFIAGVILRELAVICALFCRRLQVICGALRHYGENKRSSSVRSVLFSTCYTVQGFSVACTLNQQETHLGKKAWQAWHMMNFLKGLGIACTS